MGCLICVVVGWTKQASFRSIRLSYMKSAFRLNNFHINENSWATCDGFLSCVCEVYGMYLRQKHAKIPKMRTTKTRCAWARIKKHPLQTSSKYNEQCALWQFSHAIQKAAPKCDAHTERQRERKVYRNKHVKWMFANATKMLNIFCMECERDGMSGMAGNIVRSGSSPSHTCFY